MDQDLFVLLKFCTHHILANKFSTRVFIIRIFVSYSTSQVAPWPLWNFHWTFTSPISLFLDFLAFKSTITSGSSTKFSFSSVMENIQFTIGSISLFYQNAWFFSKGRFLTSFGPPHGILLVFAAYMHTSFNDLGSP